MEPESEGETLAEVTAASSEQLVAELRAQGISDAAVLRAIAAVPRTAFVPPEFVAAAWKNIALPIGLGQTISQPYIVALMTQALRLCGTETVLEIGTGSGYQTAVLAQICGRVISLERLPELLVGAQQRLAALEIDNVELHEADGTLGWPAEAPYPAILVAAAGPRVPESLLEQLVEGGRLVIPVGEPSHQQLFCYHRQGNAVTVELLADVRFVPLVGDEAWADEFYEK